jgi:hypothetical protein
MWATGKHADNREDSATKGAQRPPGVRAARRNWGLDRRTNTSKRLLATMKDLARQCDVAFDANDALLRRAAELAVAAEVGRRDLLRGANNGINVDLLLRLEGCAARATRDLAARARAMPSTEPTPLQDYLRQRAASADAFCNGPDSEAPDRAVDRASEPLSASSEAAQ